MALTWKPNPQFFIDGYNVYRSATSGTGFEKLNEVLVRKTTATDLGSDGNGLPEGTYFYRITAVTFEGRESDPSTEVKADVGTISIFIPDTNGPAGEIVEIPIGTQNGDGVAGMDIQINFDSTILTINGWRFSGLTTEWLAPVVNQQIGQIRLMLLAPPGTALDSQGGALFFLSFSVNSKVGEGRKSSMTFARLDLSDSSGNAITSEKVNGTFTVSKAYFAGDVSGDGVMNIQDAVKLLNIALGFESANSLERSASEMSGDGELTYKDLIMWLRKLAGVTRELGTEETLRVDSKTVSIGNYTRAPGSLFTASVRVDNEMKIAGGSFTLGYDSSKLTLISVERGDLISTFSVFGNNPNDLPSHFGQIQIDFANSSSLGTSGGGNLVNMTFQIASSVPEGLVIPLTIQSASLSDERTYEITVSAVNGSVLVPANIPALSKLGIMVLVLVLSALFRLYRRKPGLQEK